MATAIIPMFHLGRVGSTVLGDMLNQHPAIGWGSEIYAARWRLWHGQGDPSEFIWRHASQHPRRWFGFEVKRPHLRVVQRGLGDLVAGYRAGGTARFIILRRENTLRKIASTAVARATGRFHLHGGEGAPPQPHTPVRVRIEPNAHFIDGETRPLVEFLEVFDRFHASLDEVLADDDPLRLGYETDVLDDPRRAYHTICAWLGEEAVPVTLRYTRTTPFPLRDVIENYDEVAAALHGTRWAWMLSG
jgi:hypothetical protein